MGEIYLMPLAANSTCNPTVRTASAAEFPPVLELATTEDAIECDPPKRFGCAFWRGDWRPCAGSLEARITVRELGTGGPGYCFFETRCAKTRTQAFQSGWYLNWRSFRPARGMRLIADYRQVRTTGFQSANGLKAGR